MVAFGAYALYQAISETTFYRRGFKHPIPTMLGRTFYAILGRLSIIGALLVAVGPF
jgi:hypothetical protein